MKMLWKARAGQNLITRVRGIASKLLEQPFPLRVMMVADRALLRLALYRTDTSGSKHVILNSPGSGNIGDQAMFESFIANVQDEIVAIVRSTDAYSLPSSSLSSRVSFLVLPSLVYSKFAAHYRDIWILGRSIRNATSFSVMGADIMDGGYGVHSSMVEWNIARTIQDAGIPARILGFSWNGKAHPEIVRQAREAGLSGVRILPRDPDSCERLLKDDVSSVTQASDMVFAFPSSSVTSSSRPVMNTDTNAEKKMAVVNVSGLIGSRIEQNVEYEHVLETLEDLGYSCLLLPHVSHSNVDDIAAISSLRAQSAVASRARFQQELMSPTDVLEIVRKADVVVTGRMHLSILALSTCTPVIVLATQGKVSGLMKLFGIPDHCVEPTVGFGRRIARLLVGVEKNREEILDKVSSNLPAVRALCQINFEHE
jgi:colanic acid/amylovoran biosynthesis protein